MITRRIKKIYIIGANPLDFYDLTIESEKIISESDIVILSKRYSEKYSQILNQNNKIFLYEEDLASDAFNVNKQIYNLLKKYNQISHLVLTNPFLCFENEQENFFKKKKISVEKIIGVFDIISWLNNKHLFLTDRKKNSSFSFFSPSNVKDCENIFNAGNFEKLIIKVEKKIILKNILKFLKNKDLLHCKIMILINGRLVTSPEKINLEKNNQHAYVIIENE